MKKKIRVREKRERERERVWGYWKRLYGLAFLVKLKEDSGNAKEREREHTCNFRIAESSPGR